MDLTKKKTSKVRDINTNTYNSTESLNNAFNILNPDDNMEMEDKASNTNTPTKSPANNIKKYSSPPIIVLNTNIKSLITTLNKTISIKDKFTLAQTAKNTVTITPKDSDDHAKFKEILTANGMQFYTFTPKGDKPKTLVLKGVKGGYTENDVKEEIKNMELKNVNIIKVAMVIFNKNYKDNYHFIVQISQDSDANELKAIKVIAHQKVKWEYIRKNKIYQCKKCQRLGHASTNCHLQY